MKKILFLLLAFSITHASAQTIDLATNDWTAQFSKDLKSVTFWKASMSGALDTRKYSFSNSTNTATESYPQMGDYTVSWTWKKRPASDNFTLSKDGKTLNFYFQSNINGKLLYKINFTYSGTNAIKQLFGISRKKQLVFVKENTTDVLKYTLGNTGLFIYKGGMSEGDNSDVLTKGLYALAGGKLYFLPLLINRDPSVGFVNSASNISLDLDISLTSTPRYLIYPSPGNFRYLEQ